MSHEISTYLDTIRTAVHDAFGHDHIDAIDLVSGGASGAVPFRVQIRDRRYVVRVEGAAGPLRNPHQYESMRIASEHGIAPQLHHVNETTRVSVMDFIEEQPLTVFPGGRCGLVEAVGKLLALVRATPVFPVYVVYPDIVGRLWDWVCRSGLFAPGALDPYTERLASICETYVCNPDEFVSAHNDPVPRNILSDGTRLWLIDWESAYRNDPLVDTAIALDNLAPSPELETALLNASWTGRLDGDFHLRLGKVRMLTRLYYAGVLLSASFAGSGSLEDKDLHAPTIEELRRGISDGRMRPGSPMMAHVMGKMYLASFLIGTVPPSLDTRLLFDHP